MEFSFEDVVDDLAFVDTLRCALKDQSKRHVRRHPPQIVAKLEKWAREHLECRPSRTEMQTLGLCTGLDLTQLNNWFTNRRRRKPPLAHGDAAALAHAAVEMEPDESTLDANEFASFLNSFTTDEASCDPQPKPLVSPERKNFSKEQTDQLRNWAETHTIHPKAGDIRALASETQLSPRQISNWFQNYRKRTLCVGSNGLSAELRQWARFIENPTQDDIEDAITQLHVSRHQVTQAILNRKAELRLENDEKFFHYRYKILRDWYAVNRRRPTTVEKRALQSNSQLSLYKVGAFLEKLHTSA
mgnify:CR=1 FL=1